MTGTLSLLMGLDSEVPPCPTDNETHKINERKHWVGARVHFFLLPENAHDGSYETLQKRALTSARKIIGAQARQLNASLIYNVVEEQLKRTRESEGDPYGVMISGYVYAPKG
ncbi:MAG: hypothetical protein AABY02_02915 [Nanoarchaeota archaeon]